MKHPETIVIVADLHSGSRLGLAHPESEYGKPSKLQTYLYECWMWIAENWPRPDLVVLNGDVIDGKQSKSEGTGLHTTNLKEQTEMALEVVEPWLDKAKPRKIVRTAGTPYHEGFHGSLSLLDQKLGVDAVSGMEPLDIELADGKILNVKHHPEGGMGLYMGTVQDREAMWAEIGEAVNDLPRATFLVRSHLHTLGVFSGFSKVHIQTPSFQWSTPHAQKARYYRYQPVIGAVMLRYTPWATDKYVVVTKVFKNPRKEAIPYARLGKEGQA